MLSAKFIESLCGVFFINPTYKEHYLKQLHNVLSEPSKGFTECKEILQIRDAACGAQMSVKLSNGFSFQAAGNFDKAPEDSIAMIRITGAIMEENFLCFKGLNGYKQEMLDAGKNDNVKGVILYIDSPGGSVNGLPQFADFVASYEKTFNKPIVGVSHNKADSAAYFILSQAPKIYIDGPFSEVGSIGTMIALWNEKEYMKKLGIEEIIVNATKSVNKNLPYYQALNGNTSAMQQILDKYNEVFLRYVAKARKGKINLANKVDVETLNGETIKVPEVFTGKTYMGQDAVDMGLADDIGGIEAAINYIDARAVEFGRKKKKGKIVESEIEDGGDDDEDESDVDTNKKQKAKRANFAHISTQKFKSKFTMYENLTNELLASQIEKAQNRVNECASQYGVDSPEFAENNQMLFMLKTEQKKRALKVENELLKKQIEQLQSANMHNTSVFQKDIDTLTKNNAELKNNLLVAEAEFLQAKNDKDALQAEINALKQSFEAEKTQLQQKADEAEQKLAALEKELGDDVHTFVPNAVKSGIETTKIVQPDINNPLYRQQQIKAFEAAMKAQIKKQI